MNAEGPVARRSSQRKGTVQSRRQPKRQRCSPSTNGQSPTILLELHLKLPLALPGGLINHVSVPTLWNHLLYARGLLPMPVYQILELEDATTNPSSRATKRKISQARKSLEQLESDWKMLEFICPDMHHVLITLGPSWNRAKESYLLHSTNIINLVALDSRQSQPSVLPTVVPSPEKNMKNSIILSRKLLRELMQVEAANCECHRLAASFQVYVSFWISTTTATKLFESNDDSLLSRLIVRHGFQPQGKQTCRHVNIHLERIGGNSNDTNLDGESDGVWVSLRTSVKGFRI